MTTAENTNAESAIVAVVARQETKCGRCGKNARLQGIEYCGRCLNRIIEKRARNAMKVAIEKIQEGQGKQKPPVPKIIIASGEKRALGCAAAVYLVKRLLGSVSVVSVTTAKPDLAAKAANGTIVIYAQCSDDIATGLIRRFIGSPASKQQASSLAQPINIFGAITEKELRLYADMKKIKYTQNSKDELQQAVQRLQERHPGIVAAVVKSAALISKIEAENTNES